MAVNLLTLALTLPSSDPNIDQNQTFTMRLTTTHGGHGGDATNSLHFEFSSDNSVFNDMTAVSGLSVSVTNPVSWNSGATTWDVTVTGETAGTWYVRGRSSGDDGPFTTSSQVVTVNAVAQTLSGSGTGDVEVSSSGAGDVLERLDGSGTSDVDVTSSGAGSVEGSGATLSGSGTSDVEVASSGLGSIPRPIRFDSQVQGASYIFDKQWEAGLFEGTGASEVEVSSSGSGAVQSGATLPGSGTNNVEVASSGVGTIIAAATLIGLGGASIDVNATGVADVQEVLESAGTGSPQVSVSSSGVGSVIASEQHSGSGTSDAEVGSSGAGSIIPTNYFPGSGAIDLTVVSSGAGDVLALLEGQDGATIDVVSSGSGSVETQPPKLGSGTSDVEVSSSGSGDIRSRHDGSGTSNADVSSTGVGSVETPPPLPGSGSGTLNAVSAGVGSVIASQQHSGSGTSDAEVTSSGIGSVIAAGILAGSGGATVEIASVGVADVLELLETNSGNSSVEVVSSGAGTIIAADTLSGTGNNSIEVASSGAGSIVPPVPLPGSGTSNAEVSSDGSGTVVPPAIHSGSGGANVRATSSGIGTILVAPKTLIGSGSASIGVGIAAEGTAFDATINVLPQQRREYSVTYHGDDASVRNELQQISSIIYELSQSILPIAYEAPERPREGMLRVADGVEWDPVGTGDTTPVIYQNASWQLLAGSGLQGPPGLPGDDGADGADGVDGTDGSRWTSSPNDPTPTVPAGAKIGDFHLNTITGNYFEVTSDNPIVWTLRGNLLGPTGTAGNDSLSGIITNDVHVVATEKDGTGYDLSAAGGFFFMFEGIVDVTSLSSFQVIGSPTLNGLTIDITNGGVYTLSGTNWTSDDETFTLRATYLGVDIDKDYTIAKSKTGLDGVAGEDGVDALAAYLTNETHVEPTNYDGTGYSLQDAGGTLKVFHGITEVTASCSFAIIGGATKDGLTIDINTLGAYSLSGAAWTSDIEVFTLRATYLGVDLDKDYTIAKSKTGLTGTGGIDGTDGIDPVIGFLTNESHVVAAATDGTGYSLTGAGGNFKVFEGVDDESTNAAFSVNGAATKNGLTINIDGVGEYSVSGASWTSDIEFFELKAVWNGVTLIKDFTIAKAKAGVDGGDGRSVFRAQIFRRSATTPNTPTGGSYNFTTQTLTPPSLWFDNPPAGSDPLYVSTASFSIIGTDGTDAATTWTAPLVLVQDGADGADGSDGLPGTPGSDGSDGDPGISVHVSNIYRRSSGAPGTPTGGSFNFGTKVLTPPSGWSETPPGGTLPLYVSIGAWSVVGQTGIDSTTTWTTPALFVQDGVDGNSPIIGFLTNQTHVVDANSDGTGYNLSEAGGDFEVFEGTTEVSGSANFSVIAPATKNGLTIGIDGAGGYTLSGASWTTNSETFLLRATYGGVTMDRKYSISKAVAGTSATPVNVKGVGATAVNAVVNPANAEAAIQINSNGKIYRRVGIGSSFTEVGTWLLSGSASDYEVLYEASGTGAAPTGQPVNGDNWLQLGTTRTWTMTEGSAGVNHTWYGRWIWRDANTLEIVAEAYAKVGAFVDFG